MMDNIKRETVQVRLWAGIFSLAASAIGLIALTGLIFGTAFPASLGSDKIPMAPSTALFFIFYGIAISLRTYFPKNRIIRRMSLTVNTAGTLASLMLLFFSYHKIYPEIERLGLTMAGTVEGAPVGHMSPLTAFCFVISSLSFLALHLKLLNRRLREAAAFWLAGMLIVICIILLLAYLYGTPLLYGSSFIPPAATTGLGLLALGIALLMIAGSPSRSLKNPAQKETNFAYMLIFLFVVLAAGIVTAGYFYYRNFERHHRDGMESELAVIADLKVRELVQWRKERLGDASVYHNNDNFSGLVKRHFEDTRDADAGKRLRTWLNKVRTAYRYDRVLLLDVHGTVRVSDPDTSEPVAPHLALEAAKSLDSGKVTFLDFHRHAPDNSIFLAVLVPILEGEDGGVPLGVLVLRISPETYLYPLIQSWPGGEHSSETLLVRREGEDVLFLNELKYQKNTALNLRFPLNQNNAQPAVKAVLGNEGIVDGRDYRGVPVIACARSVPDSPWFLVARMDLAEVYAPLRERLWLIIILVGSLLIGTGAGAGFFWRRQQSRFFRERYEAADALRESEARYRSTLDNMLEGCHIIGSDWRYLYLNAAAENHNRRPKEELLGKKYMDMWPGIETTEVFAAIKRCMEERVSRHIENQFVFPDRTSGWFELSIQPVPEGIFILSMDITERKRAQKMLHASNRFLQIAYGYEDVPVLLDEFVREVRNYTGCNAIGIRILGEAGRIPYLSYQGFSRSFYESESPLSINSDQCMCINVIKGDIDPGLPFYTDGGSFYMNGTTRFLATVSEEDKGRTRNICNQVGYESVALVPIRLNDQILGLIHVADFRDDMVPLETVKVLEKAGMQLGTVILRRRAEEEIRKLNAELEQRIADRTAQLAATNRELEAFAYSVSHDLRAPLRRMDGFSRILLDADGDKLGDQGRHYLERIRVGATEMGGLIDGLLKLSRITRSELKRSSVNLSGIALQIADDLRKSGPGRNVKFLIQKDIVVSGDPGLLMAAMQNLFENAWKFTGKKNDGCIAFGAETNEACGRPYPDLPDHVTVYFVRDDGAGFDMSYADRLFGAFQRLHRTDEFEGSGIGLATVQRIVHRHGGIIWAEGKVGDGACFYFTLG